MAFIVTPAQREVRDPEEKARRFSRMMEIEDEVYQQSAAIVAATLDFCLIAPDQQEPPPEWVERFGLEAAKQRLAVAKAGWMPASVAPAGTKLAQQTMQGIARARRHQMLAAGTPREVNAKIALPAPTAASMPGAPEYPSKEVE